jgi:carbon monoxide dehydrogenase subunit G
MSRLLSSRSIEIAAPINAVFTYAANLENFPAWFPGALSIRAKDSRPINEVGKCYEEIVGVPFGRSAKVRIEVVESNQPEHLVTEGDYAPLLPRMEMYFQAVGENQTLMEWKMYSRRRGILSGLFLPVLSLVLKSRSRHALCKLKDLVESNEKSMA